MCLLGWRCLFRLSAVFGFRYLIIASQAESLFFTLMTHKVILWAYTGLVSFQRGKKMINHQTYRNKWDSIWCYIPLGKEHWRNLTEDVIYCFVSVCLIVYWIQWHFDTIAVTIEDLNLALGTLFILSPKAFSFLFSTSLELQSGFYFSAWICCVALL